MGDNLPVVSKNKDLTITSNKFKMKVSDFSKRAGKVALDFGIAFGGLVISSGTSVLAIPVVPVIAAARISIFYCKRSSKYKI